MDFDIEHLKLAFSYQLVNQIMGADGEVVPAEARFLKRWFPAEILESSGFIRDDGTFTQRWQDALGEALMELPALPVKERLKMVELFIDAALSDGDMPGEEIDIIERAGRLLGLRPDQLESLRRP